LRFDPLLEFPVQTFGSVRRADRPRLTGDETHGRSVCRFVQAVKALMMPAKRGEILSRTENKQAVLRVYSPIRATEQVG